MASSNNPDAISQDGELPFGHPGRRSDDTPLRQCSDAPRRTHPATHKHME